MGLGGTFEHEGLGLSWVAGPRCHSTHFVVDPQAYADGTVRMNSTAEVRRS